jgi:hypothetical protein
MTDFKVIHGIYESVINHALDKIAVCNRQNYVVTFEFK